MKFTAFAAAALLLVSVSCREGDGGPTTADFEKEREALLARLEKQKKAKKKQAKRTPSRPSATGTTEVAFGAVGGGFSYDPEGKRDPFRSFEWERPDRRDEDGTRSPLERFDVTQLSLVAVVWDTGNARALIQDPSGQGYIISSGARIGKNEGRVIEIDDNLVVVKETYVDFLGQETTKDIEMRIRRSQGG